MLAQIQTVDPGHLKDFLLIALCVISAFTSIGSWLNGRNRRGVDVEPQPLEVREAEKYVTRELCEQMHQEEQRGYGDLKEQLVSLEDDVKQHRELFRRELLEEVGKLHARINQVLEAVAELRGADRVARTGPR